MKRILLTFMVIVAGLSMMAPDINAQSGYNPPPATARQKRHDAWHKDMAEFRARSEQERHLNALADSLASVQAAAAIKNQDFVLEAQSVTFKNGANTFVNSTTNFIAVKGNRAVVQISPSNFASGPNGVGGRYDYRQKHYKEQQRYNYLFNECNGCRNQRSGGDIHVSEHQQCYSDNLS